MLSTRLKELRARKRRTQEEVAKYLGVTRPAYTAYESGKRNPDYDTLIKLSDYFDVTLDYLLREEKPSVPIKEEPELKSLFPFDWVGLSQEEFEGLDAYQQEVITWAASEGGPMFLNSSQNVLDMMERLEIAYEVDQAMKKRNKNK